MSPARPRFRYDVFLSYSHCNQAWVRGWLVPRLKDAGLKVCIDHESFTPGAPLMTEIERAALASRKTVCIMTPEYLQSEWTEFENLLIQTPDPASRQRRLIPLLLSPCALPLRLGILTPLDFTRAAEHLGNVERLIEEIRRRRMAGRARPGVRPVDLPFEVPTGALSLDSPLYIERRQHRVVLQQVIRQGSTTLIEGARQMGKTSLMVRALAHARAQQCTIIDFNFQALDEQCFDTLETLLRYLVDAINERLQLAVSPEETWRGPLGAKDKCTSFMQQHVLQRAHLPVVLAVDEADRVFGRPYRDDFFALLRTWHDRRASDPLWRKLNLLLGYATDPRRAIQNLDQSPFNVGTRVQLDDFSLAEAWELNRRYQSPLQRKSYLESLMEVIGGHPSLLQQALYALAAQDTSSGISGAQRQRGMGREPGPGVAHCSVNIEGLNAPLSLGETLAITRDWDSTNKRRAGLIEKKMSRKITPQEEEELHHLQKLAGAKRQLVMPLPIKELAEIEADLRRKGLWRAD